MIILQEYHHYIHYYNYHLVKKHNVIVVTINYRLGIFGFFYHTELDKESKNKVSGNYGIMDIICAVKWIKSNIISYGGNPDNITLMGDGAGANIIVYLMCNSGNEELFQKVIINSYSLDLYSLQLNKYCIGSFWCVLKDL